MPLYTLDEAAEYTGPSRQTIYRVAHAEKIQYFQTQKRKGWTLRFARMAR